MPELPQLQSCCFCCSTETGSKILGWIATIFGTIGTIFYITALSLMSENMTPESNPRFAEADLIFAAMLLVACIFETLLGIYLLIGIAKRNMTYVRVWLRVNTTLWVLTAILLVVATILGLLWTQILQHVTALFLRAYFLLVVYSYYRENNGGVQQS